MSGLDDLPTEKIATECYERCFREYIKASSARDKREMRKAQRGMQEALELLSVAIERRVRVELRADA